jgi:outer membrane receptor protein involved in Fe transport
VDPSGKSTGFEIEIMGAPTEKLSFYASASFPTDETLQAVTADGSIRKSFRRGHSDARLNFAGNYLISSKREWDVYAQTAFGWVDDVVLNPDNKILQSGSLRWDLGFRVVHRVQKGAWEAQVRAQNVLDQRVTTGTGNAGTSPRRLSLSLTRRF